LILDISSIRKKVFVATILVFFFWISAPRCWAKVTGVCSNCHTMHYSQNGGALVAWGSTGPYQNLLVDTCVGCHSNTSTETIKTLGSGATASRVPVVYNTVEPTYPTTPSANGPSVTLAGGNFYWVEKVGDQYGHNVISHADAVLTEAPGRNQGCTNSCHYSLYSWTFPWPNSQGHGCTACHTPAHHKGGSSTPISDEEDGWYRFLAQRHGTSNDRNIKGLEDPDWQQSVSPTDHNEYWDYYVSGPGGVYGISRFCAGCHGLFHSTRYGPANGGFYAGAWFAAPWLRHPAGIYFPSTGETSKYNTDGTGPEGVPGPYNPLAPVGRQNIDSYTAPSSSVTVGSGGDMVMCLSCHRAHGSPYPDMLRWDYTTCQAGTPNSSCGCFICHTEKDQ